MSCFRVQKWRAFAHRWFLYDAYMQCPMLSGELLASYLTGSRKRIYDPRGDCGDSVIVFNSRHIAAKDNSLYWRRFLYTHHTRFGPYRVEETMEEMHARDPTEILRREVRSHLKNWTGRPDWLSRLHIFADGIETLPEELIKNVSGVIRQVLPVPRRLEAYSTEEIEAYPKLFDWPENYAARPLSTYTKPRPRAGKVPTVTESKT
uniref:39S ribosomal protein L13 n=1 Tax=Echinococcus canadensis TaxID=519352 RepID=A0A915EV86_9CEST